MSRRAGAETDIPKLIIPVAQPVRSRLEIRKRTAGFRHLPDQLTALSASRCISGAEDGGLFERVVAIQRSARQAKPCPCCHRAIPPKTPHTLYSHPARLIEIDGSLDVRSYHHLHGACFRDIVLPGLVEIECIAPSDAKDAVEAMQILPPLEDMLPASALIRYGSQLSQVKSSFIPVNS